MITGATQGIGLAATDYFSKEGGYQVYAGCRDLDSAEAVRKLSESMSNIKVIPLDVTSDSSVKNAVAEILKNEITLYALCVISVVQNFITTEPTENTEELFPDRGSAEVKCFLLSSSGKSKTAFFTIYG